MIAEITFNLDIVLGSLIVALPGIITAWNTRRLPVALPELKAAVEQVHKTTNSMKDELVHEVREASFAAGAQSEKDKK
jgi:hypothetical protein